MGLQVRRANDLVDYFDDRYGSPEETEHENLFHEAEVDSDNRLTIYEVHEKWYLPPQEAPRPSKRENEAVPKELGEQRKRIVALYLPGQWTSYRVTPVEPQPPSRRSRSKRPKRLPPS